MFTNEIISENEIEQNNLDKIMESFNRWYWRNGRPSGFEHSWTIDRERNVFLVKVGTVEELGPSGRDEPTNRQIFILNCCGVQHQILIEKLPKSSSDFSDSPYRVFWRILEIVPASSHAIGMHELVGMVKEAMSIYGHRGALRQIPGTVVEFD